MDTARKPRLNISFLGKEHVISVSRDVVRALGKPAYVRLLKNPAQHSVALQACDEKELLSFKVPERLFDKGYSSGFRIYSLSFVDEIINAYHLDYGSRCTFSGNYLAEHNAVVFPLSGHEGDAVEEMIT